MEVARSMSSWGWLTWNLLGCIELFFEDVFGGRVVFCLDMPHKDDWEFKNLVLYIGKKLVLILKTSFIQRQKVSLNF